ncbi:low-density lipoprotein receptor-related protein 12-like [Anneissia japonica]|uniref:low-density lipoprotein receptor-related protein 12-like n=1 Tax=Anneissia japonica TaxID=1529436 RepID=UPI001425B9CE|nr:low-density lipoprotein receptor-related protein 12-like [Anneissia japonica]
MISGNNLNVILLIIVCCHSGILYTQGCGDIHHRGQGEIRSPNYPDPYNNNENCVWKIKSYTGEVVTIRFQHMDIERGAECIDSLKCTFNRSVTETYCGTKLPNPITTQYATLEFTTDQTNVRDGFLLDFYTSKYPASSCNQETEFFCKAERKCIPINWKCDGQSECSDGADEADSECRPVTSVVPVTQAECGLYYFYCRSAKTHEYACYPEVKKCDTVRDCEDGRDEEGCQQCIHYLHDSMGYFTSPNFPSNYGFNLLCQWKVIVKEGNTIQLRYVDFMLDGGEHTDYIWVYDGGSEYADRYGPYFGSTSKESSNMPPKVIESTGDRMLITFHSDSVSNGGTGFNFTYQTKGSCLSNQLPCSDGTNCYDRDLEKCDGKFACSKGEDEMGCFNCKDTQIACSTTDSGCYTPDKRCDGQASCNQKEDESNCPVELCNDVKGLFLCDNKHCIFESWKCDLADDCDDNSDERDCPVSNKVITAAVVGSIICGLLLVAALSCTCKLYQLHSGDPYQPSHTSPMQEIEQQLLWREAPPSYIATMASPHYSQAQQEFISNGQAPVASSATTSISESRRTRRPNFFRMLSWDRFSQRRSRDRGNSGSHSNTVNADGQAPTSTTEPDVIHQQISANRPNPAHVSGIPPEDEPTPTSTELQPNPPTPLSEPSPSSESGAVSDTDSDTNHEASDRDHLDRRILYAAANLRRIRINGGVQNLYQHTAHINTSRNCLPSQAVSQNGMAAMPRSSSNVPLETVEPSRPEPMHTSVSTDAITNICQAGQPEEQSSRPVQTHSRAASDGSVISTGSDCTAPLLGRPTRESLC